jgi:hypothetical protein
MWCRAPSTEFLSSAIRDAMSYKNNFFSLTMSERKSKNPANVTAASKNLAAGQSFVMDHDGTPLTNSLVRSCEFVPTTEHEWWVVADNTGNRYMYWVDSGVLELIIDTVHRPVICERRTHYTSNLKYSE